MSSMTDYLENKIVDWLFRGQAFSPPATMYVGLFTAAPTDAGGGTEVQATIGGNASNYARVPVTSGLTEWAGTQAAASTIASSGTSGTTSNNAAITFPTPAITAGTGWGNIIAFGIFDSGALGSGNLLFYANLTTAKTINPGDAAPSFAIGALTVQIDN